VEVCIEGGNTVAGCVTNGAVVGKGKNNDKHGIAADLPTWPYASVSVSLSAFPETATIKLGQRIVVARDPGRRTTQTKSHSGRGRDTGVLYN